MPKGVKDKTHKRAGVLFTTHEAHEMMCRVFDGQKSLRQHCEETGRSYHAVYTKIWKVLGKYRGEDTSIVISTERSGRRWTQYELDCLDKALKWHQDYEWLAHCFKRTAEEVKARAPIQPPRGAGFGFSG